ncbi:insulinase family protein [Mucilaginibacter sp. RS28]|uniref:Insulinase family protein n=1 Tax=Mucilaginibacter straminoryzae TaxID=2932774 RepID=A0A9X2B881_9SPHI|nr:pitrilysin family protein [Mucilaginibacter straminoryzae]MCJ8209354.1 insulinase family protein [Mucilaginibacter straminoryzae]
MKRTFILIFSLILSASATFAQPSTRTTTSFMVNGLKVIFKPTVKEVISVRMYYRGGVYNYPKSQAGIENFALKAATECGTKKYSANAFRDMTDEFGISIGGSSSLDYGNIAMECISKYFDQGWSLFAEAIMHPAFEPNEVELLKSKVITRANTQQSDPDQHIEDMVTANAFAGSPYATDPEGTEQSILPLKAQALKLYYTKLLNKNRMFLVVAGKISRQQLEQKIRSAFAALPAKPYSPPVQSIPVWTDNNLNTESRALATNYISAAFNAPAPTSPDYLPFRMGISALSGSIFAELRTRRNLSYDPGAYLVSNKISYGILHVSTNDPQEAVSAMVTVVNRIRAAGISDEGLEYLKNSFITSNYSKQQGSGAISSNLGAAEINGGWQYAENLPQMLSKVTVAQINRSLNKYISGLRWSYLGDTNLAKQAVDAFSMTVH